MKRIVSLSLAASLFVLPACKGGANAEAVKLVPDEADAAAAIDLLQAWLQGRVRVLQPPHGQAEVCAVLARLRPAQIADDLADLLDLALPVRDDAAVYARAMQLSRDLGHHLFDTLYHAVALETDDALLVTADERYLAQAAGAGRVRHLRDWQASR